MEPIVQIDIKENIVNTLQMEAKAILKVSQSIEDNVIGIISFLHNLSGKIIITGIGKSSIVAQKIVATLNSTGANSVFLHAADALHGDLGIINDNDCIICISKSGDTPEIKVLIPILKGFGNKIISITSNNQSFLYRNADMNIYLPMDKEVDPNNLAPTTSTTLQMAMGDAIAVCLLSLKGFDSNSFAKFHPGGSLGKQLYLTVIDILQQSSKPVVYENDTINSVIIEISSKRLGATVVLDNDENIKGIITDGDLRRMLLSGNPTSNLLAKDIMSPNPKMIQYSDLAVNALEILKLASISQLIVIKGNRYVGIIHIHDIIREGII